MPLTAFQRGVLALMAPNRTPHSLFTGGAIICRASQRISEDFDLEQRNVAAVAESFAADRAALELAGYSFVPTPRCQPKEGFMQAEIARDGHSLRLDWVVDSAWRFLPPIRDPDFGWRLTDEDVAVNKLLALAGRRALRDYIDIVDLHRRGFFLAALAWAGPGKDAGLSPAFILDEASRHSIYSVHDYFLAYPDGNPFDPVALKATFLTALEEGRRVVQALTEAHPEHVGKLCLDRAGKVALPDLEAIAAGAQMFHGASLGGAWPGLGD